MSSVDKRPNGMWRARWREYPGGPQRARHFPRKIDAERFLVKVQHRLMSGVYTSPAAGRITLAQSTAEWLDRRRRRWRAATFDRYERELRLHILPTLARWPVAHLRREHFEAWVADLPLAPSSSALVAQTDQDRRSLVSGHRCTVAEGTDDCDWPSPPRSRYESDADEDHDVQTARRTM
jgi:hypothetical protein